VLINGSWCTGLVIVVAVLGRRKHKEIRSRRLTNEAQRLQVPADQPAFDNDDLNPPPPPSSSGDYGLLELKAPPDVTYRSTLYCICLRFAHFY
jgi:hypothetical protein